MVQEGLSDNWIKLCVLVGKTITTTMSIIITIGYYSIVII